MRRFKGKRIAVTGAASGISAIEATIAGLWAEPEEVARVALFRLSEEASFPHGSPYLVDDGWSLV